MEMNVGIYIATVMLLTITALLGIVIVKVSLVFAGIEPSTPIAVGLIVFIMVVAKFSYET